MTGMGKTEAHENFTGSRNGTGYSGRTAERSSAAASAPQKPAAALAELMPGVSAGRPADTGVPAPLSAAFLAPGRRSFFNSAFAVFLVALVLRLVFAWSGITGEIQGCFIRPDSAGYLAPAVSLMDSGEYRGPDGALTAHRTPGLPSFLAVLITFGVRPAAESDTVWLSVILLILGALTVFPVYCSCRYFSGRTCSAAAALLFAMNPTAVAHAPMLLSDTFFMLLTAFVLFFFISYAYGMRHDLFYFYSAATLAALSALVRPVGLFFFLPLIAALFLTADKRTFRQKAVMSATTYLICFAVLLPWILRNHSIGAGWRLDAGSATTMVHNASALESVVMGTDGDTLRRRYEEQFRMEYEADPLRYNTDGAKMDHVEKTMASKILAHPVRYILLSLRPWVFLPDIPTFLEIQGVTQTERGTFDVLNREGIFAAVAHYFDGNGLALLGTLPLLIGVLILYLAAVAGFILAIRRKQWLTAFLLFAFGLYFTLMTGPVQMPRYQMPALPVLCVLAAITFQTLAARRCEGK